jgi:chromosome segregation ATPase
MKQTITNLSSDNSELRAQLQQCRLAMKKKDQDLSAYLQAEQDYQSRYFSEKDKEIQLETKYNALQQLYSHEHRMLERSLCSSEIQDEKTKKVIWNQKKDFAQSLPLNLLGLATQGTGYKITISELTEQLQSHQRLLEQKCSDLENLTAKVSDLEAEILPLRNIEYAWLNIESELTNRIKILEMEILPLREIESDWQNVESELTNRIKILEMENSKISDLEAEILPLRKIESDWQNIESDFQNTEIELTNRIKILEMENSKISDMEAEILPLRNIESDFQNMEIELTNRIKRLETENSTLLLDKSMF